MPDPWFLGGSVLGGAVAGLVALLVGGLGVWRIYRVMLGAMAILTEAVEGVQRRVEREIKTRAGEGGGRPSKFDLLAEEVLARGAAGAAGGAAGADRNLSRAEILRRADAR